MENLSRSDKQVKIPLTVTVPDYMRDHCYDGRVVLPAVEALQILARSLPAELFPGNPCRLEKAHFAHLLHLAPETTTFEACHEIELIPDGGCFSRLTTVRTGRQTKWTRRVENASVIFVSNRADQCDSDMETAGNAGASFSSFTFPSRRLYEDLVPFGHAYRNVTGDVKLSEAGASTWVSGGQFREANGPLGSPFPMDAAMHMACAWGQRFRDMIAFPVGFVRRDIFVPTRNGEIYLCRVFARPSKGAVLLFDIGLYGEDLRAVEIIRGLKMQDISSGRMKPPAWVKEGV